MLVYEDKRMMICFGPYLILSYYKGLEAEEVATLVGTRLDLKSVLNLLYSRNAKVLKKSFDFTLEFLSSTT